MGVSIKGHQIKGSAGIPTGAIIAYGGLESPNPEWLLCDGSMISKKDYGPLWNVIGGSWGTNTIEMFSLPDSIDLSVKSAIKRNSLFMQKVETDKFIIKT